MSVVPQLRQPSRFNSIAPTLVPLFSHRKWSPISYVAEAQKDLFFEAIYWLREE